MVNDTLIEIEVPLEAELSGDGLRQAVARRTGDAAPTFAVVRRSLDARKGKVPRYRYVVRLGAPASHPPALPWPRATPLAVPPTKVPSSARRIAIVGSGPAGLFAALRLVQAGVLPILVERGKPVQPRRHDLAKLTRGQLDQDSNYCFGEGGAGTYSDGKLYTRTKDREATQRILAVLAHFGADESILYDSRPHIGSNKLPKLIVGLRTYLQNEGVEYVWSDPVVGFIETNPGRIRGVTLRSGRAIDTDAVVLAVGHSARDVYSMCARAKIAMESKPLAMGVRVEHPQVLIDTLQYGRFAQHAAMPAAFYHVTSSQEGRGVYSFCMCPGGWVVPSATEENHLCTNGMSLSRRDSPFANAALVVTVSPADFGSGLLGGVELQRSLEHAAFVHGGSCYRAPGQRVSDFVAGRASTTVAKSSYRPGIMASDLREFLPPFLLRPLRQALVEWGRRMPGFVSEEAQLIGVETRTSAPVRIVRDPATLASPSHPGLYPCGEGAGYAGGIISAAIDGVRVAERIIETLAVR